MRAYRDPTADAAIANVMKEQKNQQGKGGQSGRKNHHPQRDKKYRRTDQGGLNGSPFSCLGNSKGGDGNGRNI